MASIKVSMTNFSPNIYSTANVTQASRNGTSVKLNISISTNLRYSSSYLGSGYVLTGRVTAYGKNHDVTIKKSSATWSGTSAHTNTATMSLTVPANITSITIGYRLSVSGSESASATGSNTTLTLSKVLATVTAANNFTDTTNPILTFSNPGGFWLKPYLIFYASQGGARLTSLIPNGMTDKGASISSPYTWNLTEEQRNQIRNALGNRTTAYVLHGADTMSGSTILGTSNKGCNFTNVLSPPTFADFEYEDINVNTTSITGDSSKIILGYSTLQITISGNNKAIANKGASMSYYLVNGVQYTYSDNVVITLENWNSSTITVTAVDSRGVASSPVTKNLTVAEYTPLEKGDATLVRDGNVSKETKLNYSGKVTKTLPNGNANTLNTTYKYKKISDTTYTTGTTSIAPTTDNDGNFDFDNYIVGDIVEGFSINDSFNIIVTISDVLSSVQYNLTLNSGIPAIAVKENNIAIHGAYDVSLGGTQIYGDLFHNGEPIGEIDSYVNGYDGYIRFKNGIQIAWTEASVRTNSMAQWGNLYYQDFSGFQDWLEPFTGVFQQYATCSSFQFWVASSDASATSPGAVRILRPTSANTTIYVKAIAIGSWK